MDTFALLSSSTRRRKISDGIASTEVQDRPNLKRKRGVPRERRAVGEHTGLHGENGSASTSQADRASGHSQVSAAASDGVKLPEATTPEERKRVLKNHKIKIARLWEPQNTDMKKRRSHASPKRKETVAPEPLTHFRQLSTRYALATSLAINLNSQGFSTPTEVQLASLPLLLHENGGVPDDRIGSLTPACHLLSIAPTGSGKTLAFLIPTIQSIIIRRQRRKSKTDSADDAGILHGPLALILAPTKELAKQIVNEGRKLCHMTGVRVTLVKKGMGVAHVAADEEADDSPTSLVKSDILVSTPQSILNAAKQNDMDSIAFPTASMLVLDEADVLLDPLFREQTMSVWSACTHVSLQVSLWSATMGSNIEQITKSAIEKRQPPSQLPLHRLVVGLKDSSIPNIDHRLVYAASERGKLTALRQLLRPPHESALDLPKVHLPFLVFTQTIPRAIALHAELLYDVPSEAGGSSRIAVLHADLSDTARDRIMAQFRKGEIWILITTDLLARGVDFRGINGVVNYDLPTSSAAYVHRVGRTGRAGREGGVAVTLYSQDDLPFVKNVANVISASERMRGGESSSSINNKWILNSLPKVSKRDKQRLKKQGIESRSRSKSGDNAKAKDMSNQISTKSAFERREERRRRQAIESSQKRRDMDIAPHNDEESFGGFDD